MASPSPAPRRPRRTSPYLIVCMRSPWPPERLAWSPTTHSRAGQGLGERVPRNQDLVHQCNVEVWGRGGDVVASPGHRPRRQDRSQVPRCGHRLRRWLLQDIRAFMARAGELGADQTLTFLREVDAINLRRRARTVDLPAKRAGDPPRQDCRCPRSASRPNSDDIETPRTRHRRDDPGSRRDRSPRPPCTAGRAPTVRPDYVDTIAEAVAGAHVVRADRVAGLPRPRPSTISTSVERPVIIDGRSKLTPRCRAAGGPIAWPEHLAATRHWSARPRR